MNNFLIVATVIAVWRVTRLLTDDFIFQWLRDLLDKSTHTPIQYIGYLVSCTWCASVWFAAPAAWFLHECAGLSTAEAWMAWPCLSATTVWITIITEWADNRVERYTR